MTTRNQHIFGTIVSAFVLFAVSAGTLHAQHNGNELAFQGFSDPSGLDVRGMGRGGASAAEAGHLGGLFSNPAGLAGITSFQLGLSAKYARDHWREEQVWYQNRFYPMAPLLMEGLYVPDPNHDGTYYTELLFNEIDPNEISAPVMGEAFFSSKRADWTQSRNRFPLNYAAAALPVTLAGRNVVAAASFARQYDVSDFDRNDTFLDPHYGYLTSEVVAPDVDTLRVNWWRYQRAREGGVYSITGAVSVEAFEFLDLGVRGSYLNGSTDDMVELDQFGVLEFADRDNAFTHSDNLRRREGTSDFDGMIFTAGVLAHLGRLQAGLEYQLPHSITREWSYDALVRDEGAESSERLDGRDELSLPGVFTLGLRIAPREDFVIYGDVRHAPLGSTRFEMDSSFPADSTYRSATHWVDRSVLGFGVDYRPIERLTIRIGYRSAPEAFVPTGAAKRSAGPDTDGYTAGLSLEIFQGRFDVAYEHRRLKYLDSYQTNTNYTFHATDQVLVGYTLEL